MTDSEEIDAVLEMYIWWAGVGLVVMALCLIIAVVFWLRWGPG